MPSIVVRLVDGEWNYGWPEQRMHVRLRHATVDVAQQRLRAGRRGDVEEIAGAMDVIERRGRGRHRAKLLQDQQSAEPPFYFGHGGGGDHSPTLGQSLTGD